MASGDKAGRGVTIPPTQGFEPVPLFHGRYSILGEHSERFAVDANSGAVTLAAPLDREERSVYHMTIVAQDSSVTEPRATAVNLTVIVVDENDNDPVFSASKYTVHVPAGTSAGKNAWSVPRASGVPRASRPR